MNDILVICRNCGEIQRYDEKYFMIPNRKKYMDCRCGNRNCIYQSNRKWANKMIKQINNEVITQLINEDKYNSKIFGCHKGFDYKKVAGDK